MIVKPVGCPFCGEVPTVFKDTLHERAYFRIRCVGCGAHGPWFNTRKESVTHWNTRQEPSR